MRFHRLEIHNLNSLYGDDHIVDFDEDLAAAPLFLIMGPTGSGKSTLLDAICLALFGQTPRQRDKNNPKDVAEAVMSRTTGECSAKLEFSRIDPDEGRIRYRAKWYCNRAHKKPGKRMQKPKRSIDKWVDGQWKPLIADSKTAKHFQPLFEEARAGMSLDDFLRSILLAQGDFTAFLDADEETKAKILETLTDTAEYEAIGRRAMNRWRSARDKKRDIEAGIDAMELLDDDQLEAVRREKAELDEQIEEKSESLEALKTRERWRKRRAELEDGVEEAAKLLEKAEEAKEERADDEERLRRAKQAQPLASMLKRCDDLEEKIEELDEEIDELQETIDDGEEDCAEKKEALEASKGTFDEAKEEKKERADEIKEARRLRAELKSANDALEDAKKAEKKAKKAVENTEEELTKAKEEREAADKDRESAKKRLDELSAHEGVATALAGLEVHVKSLEDREEALEERREERSALAEERREEEEKREKLEEELEEKNKELEELEDKYGEKHGGLERCLDGEEDVKTRRSQLSKRRDNVKDWRRQIERAGEKLDEFGELTSALEERREEVVQWTKELEELKEDGEGLDDKIKLAKERVKLKEEKVDVRRLPIELAKKRKQLVSDEPCPLCGSTSHPYGDDPPNEEALEGEFEEAKDELKEAKGELTKRQDEKSELDKKISGLAAKLETHRETLEESEDERAELDESIGGQLEPLAVSWRSDDLEAVATDIEERRDELEEETKDLESALERLEEAKEAARKAEKAVEDCKREINSAKQSLKNSDAILEKLAKRIKDLDEDIEAKVEKLDTAGDELAREFADVGVEVDREPDDGFEQALEVARSKKKARKAANEDLEEAEETYRERNAEVEKLEDRLPEQKQRLEEAGEEREKRKKTVEELKQKTDAVLDGRAPDVVEAELEKSVVEAEKALETARQQFEKVSRRLDKHKAKLEEKTKRYDKLRDEHEESKKTLVERLDAAGFDSEDDLREAIVSPEAFKKLEEEIRTLTDRVNSAKSALKGKEEELARHRKEEPDGFDSSLELEDLSDRIEALTEEVNDRREERGAKREVLKREDKLRKRQAKMVEKLGEAKRDFGLWKQMKELIGAGEGERFKQFAQALNLENIVHHANQHLVQLSERYRLAVVRDETGHPRLDFEVIDTFQSDRARSLSTLSGGETFLVSLSLALALADFRQVHMPVETLLLDEGFGTLDQESLEEAVKVLKSLHTRDDRRVGVISHVEQLQERIGHRVVLEKLGGGRSQIAVETPV